MGFAKNGGLYGKFGISGGDTPEHSAKMGGKKNGEEIDLWEDFGLE